MKFYCVVTAFFLLVFFSDSASASWKVLENVDEMTGEVLSVYAVSSDVVPTRQMSFPYGDVESYIGYACERGNEWVLVGFFSPANLMGDEIHDGYNSLDTRVKWDERIENMRFIQSRARASNFLTFEQTQKSIQYIMQSNSMLLEVPWHGQGKVYFRYSLAGASKAISQARARGVKCSQ